MSKLKVSENGRFLECGGESFFWLGDTCWSAFTNISDEEWLQYLDIRKQQGVNVLQINALPQWDRCGTDRVLYPFQTEDKIHFSFESIQDDYFTHARWMCEQAVQRGFVLALVVMWCNYVPGTWASRIAPYNVIPSNRLQDLIQKLCESFDCFDPVYLVSGDAGFEEKETIERYLEVTELLERYSPDSLKAYHIKGRYDELPELLAEHADFYMYQSGHNPEAQEQAYELGRSFLKRDPQKPVLNGEPCYEQMGYSHHAYGRFRRDETRKALWNSLLSGASAGITYGAHGIWNWQKADMPKNPIAGEGFLDAMEVKNALHFQGILDYAFAKDFFKTNGITEIIPIQEIVDEYSEHIRAGKMQNGILLYVPTNAPFNVTGDFADYQVQAIDLETHCMMELQVKCEDGKMRFPMHNFNADALIVIRTKKL